MNNGEIKIEHNIPVPDGLHHRASALSRTLRLMNVGDSIVVTQRQRNAAFAIVHKTGVKLASRRINNEEDQIRLWRIK